MAKFTPRLNDKKEFNRLKARAKRVIKKAKEHGFDISNDIDLPKSINHFKTRKEFNSYIEKLNHWSHPSNMSHQYVKTKRGDYITKKEEQTFKLITSAINEKRKRENKKIRQLRKNLGLNPDGSLGKQVIIHKKVYNVTDDGLQLPLKSPDKHLSRESFLKRLSQRTKQSQPNYGNERQEQMRSNFLNLIKDLYGDDANEIVAKFKSMHFEDFFTMYRQFDEFQSVFFASGQEELANMGIQTTYKPPKILELESYYEQYINMKNKTNNK